MEVEVIKAVDKNSDNPGHKKFSKLRVAAYCRVSTDDEDQIKSYDSMVLHYTNLIKDNPDWIFAGVYADKALTGTKDNREQFQSLIADCMDGKIDLILAKSIPRFARNTLDTLKYVRMLKERNIAISFEVEKINTLRDGEFLMTILSSVAQQEVENTSAYVKKGLKMKMRRGELVGFQGCMGYDYDPETKTISVNEEGADIVRYIFMRYTSGAGCTVIARELNSKGLKTIRGNNWCASTVLGIIENEKYMGDLMMGKTYTVDPISKRRLSNTGEEDRYYIKEHHEPIIDKDTYEKAQELLHRRRGSKVNVAETGKREKYSRQYAFSSMLECGYCGANLSRRSWHSSSKYQKTIWACIKSTKAGKKYCPDSKGIPEEYIEKAFVESYRSMSMNNKDVLKDFLKRTEQALKDESSKLKLTNANNSLSKWKSKRKKLLDEYLAGNIPQDIYTVSDNDCQDKIAQYNKLIEELEEKCTDEDSLRRRLLEFQKVLDSDIILEEFDRDIFESLIDKVIVGGYDENGNKDPYKLTFIYKTGFTDSMGDCKKKFKSGKGIETLAALSGIYREATDQVKKSGEKISLVVENTVNKLEENCNELYSLVCDELNNLFSLNSDATCGDGSSFVPTKAG